MNRPEAGQVEKNRHPGRSRNTPYSSNNRNTDDVGNKIFPKSDTEELEKRVDESLERLEDRRSELIYKLMKVEATIDFLKGREEQHDDPLVGPEGPSYNPWSAIA